MFTEELVKENGITDVETESAGAFELEECIGEGGQGAVYKTQHPNLLVKLSYASKDNFKPNIVYRRYRNLRSRIDLPNNLAKPLNEIKPIIKGGRVFYGYVMELMEDMVPLSSLHCKKGEEFALYIERLGGIRRIYTLLRKLAEILNQIHAVGYCYGDLNPNNIFISSDTEFSEVQLIDCDNMTIAADFKDSISFKGFSAPEIVREHKFNTPLSDTWSFAVVAFFALRQELPFHGRLVTDAATMDISTIEKKEEEADLPFIDDQDEDNVGESAIFREVMETKNLQDLFKRTFSGEKNFLTRPALFEWIEALQIGENSFMKCKKCGKHYIKMGKKCECPFCDTESHVPYILLLNMIYTGGQLIETSSSHPTYLLEDSSALLIIPMAETKSANIKVSFNASRQQLSLLLTNQDELKATLRIDKEKTTKNCALKKDVPLLVKVKEDCGCYIFFPEYTLTEIINNEDESEESSSLKFRGAIKFKYWGEA